MLLYSLIFTLATLNPTDSTEYIALPMDATATLSDYVGKHVVFEARICEFEMNHMLRFSINGENTHFCIDQMEGDKEGIQILAYTSKDQLATIDDYEGKRFKIYGLFDSFTGRGRGQATHTEYFLELDKLELIED